MLGIKDLSIVLLWDHTHLTDLEAGMGMKFKNTAFPGILSVDFTVGQWTCWQPGQELERVQKFQIWHLKGLQGFLRLIDHLEGLLNFKRAFYCGGAPNKQPQAKALFMRNGNSSKNKTNKNQNKTTRKHKRPSATDEMHAPMWVNSEFKTVQQMAAWELLLLISKK